jgi:2-(1,2-epoxy-1,2-dihydrophenyl)acetyl-CoA isomerase
MAAEYQTIRYAVDEGIATITLNRPQVLNAYCIEMGEELVSAFRDAQKSPRVRAIIVTGAGRGFCSGADRKYFASGFRDQSGRRLGDEEFVRTFPAELLTLEKPVIAAINGPAVGIGVTLTLLCDLRIAAEEARLSLTFAKIGVMMGLGSTLLLPRLVGHGKAMEILLTQPTLDGSEAARVGLIHAAVPAERLMDEARRSAVAAAECPPQALSAIKRAMAYSASAPFEDILRYELARGRELTEIESP